MSDLPALQLFEEIQGLSNSMDFFSYTKEDLNKTWSLYDDDSKMESKEQNTEKSPATTFSGKSSPNRDAWDPMLYNVNLTTYVGLSNDDEVFFYSKPMLETPVTPLPGLEDLQMFLTVTQTSDQRQRQMSTSRDADQARHFLQHNDHHQHCSGAFLAENRSGSLPQKVK